jgi:cathepsin D
MDGGGGGGGSGSNGSGSGSNGSLLHVPLVGVAGYEYSAPVVISGVTFQAQIDTGSGDLGIAAAACGAACSGVSPLYSPGASASDQHQTESYSYADMSGWTAEIYLDNVALGGSPAVGEKFGAITSQTMFFQAGDALQGIIGLGPEDLLGPHTSSWTTQLFATGVPPAMAFRLCETSGDIWFGGYDSTAMASQAVFTPMVPITSSQPFYAVEISGMGIAGTSVGSRSVLGPTLVDTGTSFTYVPASVASALLTAVTSSSGYKSIFGTQALSATQCVSATATRAQIDAALPPMTIHFPDGSGGSTPVMSLAPTQSYLYDNGGGTWCLDVLDNTGLGLTIMGDTLQESFVSVFDIANQRIGFAPEAGCAPALSARERTVFPMAAPGQPWWSNNPYFHEPRRYRSI